MSLPFGSRLRSQGCRLAVTPGRIEFVILQTGGSPPVASHPSLRRRSYIRFQTGERMSEEDFHLSVQAPFQANGIKLSHYPLCVSVMA